MELSSLVGWVGAGLIVLAYFLVSTKRVSPTGKKYQLINVFGAIGLGVNAFVQNAYPNFGLQVIFIFLIYDGVLLCAQEGYEVIHKIKINRESIAGVLSFVPRMQRLMG
ncbi:MAG: hypothetical protein UT08_C0023G0001 [Candidatus Woesebacteria bacterium GW2011_GWB1_38_8]|uniref:CBU-0592-like domain-containing protein n=1 Tax=Candidatus Woesebacteria bacterium GW2011_GWB1_38_8 TaxID=1618570 RepID=A0A0G0P4B9_9BACT|nr:MAG: hypothetical protein UT08_C0023G0001 [Candidatus Woesebacteria bacterium GW2011_GWB1_38_8]